MWAVYADNSGITRCHFPIFNANGSIEICGAGNDEARIEVNHIIAQGYAKEALGLRPNQIDTPTNLICLCSYHHVGEGYKGVPDREQPNGDPTPVFHVDNIWARKNYKGSAKPTSFDMLAHQRHELARRGIDYCNDFWTDWMLAVAEDKYWEYYNNTGIPFPLRQNQR